MSRGGRVLIVDDEASVRESIACLLRGHGYEVTSAPDGTRALELAQYNGYDVAVIDLNMPGLAGMDAVRLLKEAAPHTEVIVLTGHATIDATLEALHEHVFDFLCKPAGVEELPRKIAHAVERRRLILENQELIAQLASERESLRREVSAAKRALEQRMVAANVLVGETEAMVEIRRRIADVAPTDLTVLIRGESGTGKEVVARLLHQFSGREGSGAFVKVNCPAIPEPLLESEMFGHERGAFTGAVRRKPGRFELAEGGTIFLDEIGSMSMGMQAKLLQVIEHKEFMRVGRRNTIKVDVRILAATNVPLEGMISAGEFRPDLFYRLQQYKITLPPLRKRQEDIPLLAQHLFDRCNVRAGLEPALMPPEMMARLSERDWPGNVRELESAVARYAFSGESPDMGTSSRVASVSDDEEASPHNKLESLEARAIANALRETKWNRRKAADLLGVSYATLRRKIAKYNLRPT